MTDGALNRESARVTGALHARVALHASNVTLSSPCYSPSSPRLVPALVPALVPVLVPAYSACYFHDSGMRKDKTIVLS